LNPGPKYFQYNVIHKVSQFMNSDKLAPRTTKFVPWALLGKTLLHLLSEENHR